MLREIFCLIALASTLAAKESPKTPTTLKFSDLLEGCVGDRGLTIGQRAKALSGQRVEITGYVVRQETGIPGRFLLTPVPVELHDEHYGLADDLPAATIFVSVRSKEKRMIPYTASAVSISGVLTIGNHEEPDGRVSLFRIEADSAYPSVTTKPARRSRIASFFTSLTRRPASQSTPMNEQTTKP